MGKLSQLVIAHALRVLDQKKCLLEAIKSKDICDYTRKNTKFYNASVGSHMRHSLQHFNGLLSNPNVQASYNSTVTASSKASAVLGLEPVLAYDVRSRATDIEEDLHAATAEINKTITILNITPINDLIDKGPSAPVKAIFTDYSNNDITTQSNVAREIVFITHHAVHHIAMIDLILKDFGYTHDSSGVGMAPSTAQYNQRVDRKT